jgi:predicted membrane channel-forming protein YqfA (hemolysin III family)
MRRYEMVSGIIFTVMALVQLIRTVLGWPVQIDLFTVPVWFSAIAFLVMGGMAVWAFRSAGKPG